MSEVTTVRGLRVLILTLLCATLVSVASPTAAHAQSSGQLIVGETVEPTNLDPIMTPTISSWVWIRQVYNTLVRFDHDGNIVPSLAESWDISDDGTTFTFNLRQSVLFHNGEELTAEDVKYTFDRIQERAIPFTADKFSNVQSVEVIDRYTVRFTLDGVSAKFLPFLADQYAVSSAIVSRKAGEELGDDFSHVMVGTGPFKFVEYEPNQRLVFERNVDYWEPGVPKLDRLVVRFIPEESSLVAALRAGEVDVIFPETQSALLLSRDRNITVKRFVADWYDGLMLNTRVAPFDDVRVRQAIMMAIDREQILQTAYLGEGAPSGALPPAHPWAVPVEELAYYPPNLPSDPLARARELLAEAGYEGGFETTMMLPIAYPAQVRAGEVLQQQLARIGIDVTLRRLEWSAFVEDLLAANYSAAVYGFLAYPDVSYYVEPRLERTGPMPIEMEQLLEQGARELDDVRRRELYQDVVRLQAEVGYPFIWLVASYRYVAHQLYVEGYATDRAGTRQGLWFTSVNP